MDLHLIWFLLLGVLLLGYGILDGFDLGVGVLHLFAKNDHERRIHINAIGPVWDGNEVWLLTGGGAMFAAFPEVYASVFSGFYLAFMLLLLALILRAVSLEFRHQLHSPGWKRLWDWCFGIGSLVPALLYGVAIGNILRGLPIDADGNYQGTFFGLLNPYALVVGLFTLTFFTMHGAAWMAMKTEGALQERMRRWISGTWMAVVVLYLVATLFTYFEAGYLLDGVLSNPLFWAAFLVTLASMAAVPVVNGKGGSPLRTFLATSMTLVGMFALVGVSLFPKLVPSTLNEAFTLTAYNASSSDLTLTVMLVIALIGMPIVLAYNVYIYKTFAGKVEIGEDSY